MNKILILGAGNAQIDAINFCRKKGYEVFGCSYTNTDRGIPLLDHFKQIDIKDVESVCEYASENKIDIVYSVGSDLAVPTAMKASERLNLRHFISYETAVICQTKNRLRSFLGADFRGNLPYLCVSSMEQALDFGQYPCMMKPTDAQGQRGCYRIENEGEIKKYFRISKSYSKSGNVILEKYVDGPEVSVNAYVHNGEVVFLLISDREVFDDLPGGIIKRHIMGADSLSRQAKENIRLLSLKTIAKLSILNGPVYFQIKLEGDKPYIIEVTPRLDGCHMWNLIKHYCGVDLLAASLEALMENSTHVFAPKPKQGVYVLEFMCERPGQAFDREKYDMHNYEYIDWYYQTGEQVKKLNGYMEKCGYQIYKEEKA